MKDPGWSPQGPVLELSVDESWERLRERNIGHLALSVDDQPEIYPVNYVCDRQTLLFRTASGEKLRELMLNRRVAFEVDAAVESGTWSVVASGLATVLDQQPTLTEVQLGALPAWIPTQQMVWVRVVPDRVRGRLFEHHLPVGRL
jgi:nitroimidazol reductase NimA-like FMN-containing flavoprotein (pyridoxamine 5'-phosphate oxidase superfamily)